MISAQIMAHPQRRHFIGELRRRLGTRVELTWDERGDRWDTGRRALLAFDPAATHHVVIQDDAIPCQDFLRTVERAVQASAEHPLGLYIGKVRPHQRTVSPAVSYARRQGYPWIAMQGPWWGVAIVLPTVHIPELVKWGDRHRHIQNYDKRIARWYDLEGIDCWYTLPSLVDHRRVHENPSLINGRNGDRRAQWFLGSERSGLEIDWDREALPIKVRFRHIPSGRLRMTFVGGPNYQRFSRQADWELLAA